MTYKRLADLLEVAAKALREADGILDCIPRSPGITSDTPLESLPCWKELSARARKCLRYESLPYAQRIRTIAELCRLSADDLRERRNCGIVTIREIRKWLLKNGFSTIIEVET